MRKEIPFAMAAEAKTAMTDPTKRNSFAWPFGPVAITWTIVPKTIWQTIARNAKIPTRRKTARRSVRGGVTGGVGLMRVGCIVPVGAIERRAHTVGNVGDGREVLMDFLVAADVRLGHFPVVDSGIAGLAGIRKDEAPVEVVVIDAYCLTGDSIDAKFDRADA